MRSRTPGPVPDVFEAFADRVEDHGGGRGADAPSVGTVARSAGVTVGLMVLTGIGFVSGAWLASLATPDLAWANPLWEGLAFLLWCATWGALAAVTLLAVGVVAVGLPWVRRQRDARGRSAQRGSRATSTSAP
jgi:hypothetical protein